MLLRYFFSAEAEASLYYITDLALSQVFYFMYYGQFYLAHTVHITQTFIALLRSLLIIGKICAKIKSQLTMEDVMIKRLLIILFALILSISTLAGCFDVSNTPDDDDSQLKGDDESNEKPDPDDPYAGVDYDGTKTYKITLQPDENCTVIGVNPLTVKSGKDAVFFVVFNTNYSFLSAEGSQNISYSTGCITVKNCTADTTVEVNSALTIDLCTFGVENPAKELGTVEISTAPGSVLKNTLISVTAKPAETQTFIGWSKGGTVIDGGEIVSYSKNYSFTISEDTKLYPNFLTEGYTVIKYDLNGGTTSDGSAGVILTQYKPVNHLAPNLIADDGKIIRPGYTLLEFTENADGSGLAVNPGGMTKLPDDSSVMTFYAQWSEWTPEDDFTYYIDTITKEVTIQSYNKDASVVSIPMEIDGYTVTSVASNAFVGKSFETLVIPRTVKTIASGGFQNCTKFDTLYITDSFTSIYNNAFVGCRAFSNLRLNASLPPHHVGHAESISFRLEQILERDEDKNMIMFVGGSSCLHAIKADVIEKELDYKYQVLNCGTNAGGTGVLYMEGLSHFMKEGDIIVNVPEYGNNQMGGTEIVWRTFRATVACYNIFRYVDFSKYTNFFTAMTEYNTDPTARYAGAQQTYDTKNNSLTPRYANLSGTRAPKVNTYSPTKVSAASLKATSVTTINNLYAYLKDKGIEYYFSCAPICHYDTNGTPSTAANLEAYYNATLTQLNCTVISDPRNYLYSSTQYYDSAYHLATEACYLHTDKIIEDLRAVLD